VTADPLSAASAVPGSPAVLRPSRAAYGRALRANIWIALPLLVVSLIRLGLNWWLLPFFAAVILLTLAGVLLYFRNARIEYVGGSYTLVSMFGGRRTFLAADAASVVTVNALLGGVPGGVPQLIVLRPDGAKILRLRGQTWDVAQFTELANDLIAHGVTHEAIPEPITRAALRDRYPKVVGWPEVHPIALGLLLSLALVVFVFVSVAVFVFSLPA
jgi:hypothetical protein